MLSTSVQKKVSDIWWINNFGEIKSAFSAAVQNVRFPQFYRHLIFTLVKVNNHSLMPCTTLCLFISSNGVLCYIFITMNKLTFLWRFVFIPVQNWSVWCQNDADKRNTIKTSVVRHYNQC